MLNKINYKVEGKGETIVLIHGLSDNLEYWLPLANMLKDNYTVIRYDLRGHGLSSSDDTISIDLLVDDLNNLLNELVIDTCILVGFSLGGVIAQDYTLKHPEKVSSLILMSSFSRCTPYINEKFLELRSAVNSSFYDFFDLILPMVLCPEVISENRSELEIIKEYASENNNIIAIANTITAMLNYDIESELEHINKPTLIIGGRYDDLIPVSIQEDMHRSIKYSELHILEDTKHNLLVGENIVKISNMIKMFIEKQ